MLCCQSILWWLLFWTNMLEKYFYHTPHRQAYVSFRVCKISISHSKIVNPHIYKTINTTYIMYLIYMTMCSKHNVITRQKLQAIKMNKWGEILFSGKKFPKIICWKYIFIDISSKCTNIKTLTQLSFRVGNMFSALWSMIFGSLLGCDCTIFCKIDESLSHMMP
jgi:hypothetical protein